MIYHTKEAIVLAVTQLKWLFCTSVLSVFFFLYLVSKSVYAKGCLNYSARALQLLYLVKKSH